MKLNIDFERYIGNFFPKKEDADFQLIIRARPWAKKGDKFVTYVFPTSMIDIEMGNEVAEMSHPKIDMVIGQRRIKYKAKIKKRKK